MDMMKERLLQRFVTVVEICCLIVWQVNLDGTITRLGSGGATGPVSLVRIIGLYDTYGEPKVEVVTAGRDGSGNLLVILWQVMTDGTVKRLDDIGWQTIPVSLITI